MSFIPATVQEGPSAPAPGSVKTHHLIQRLEEEASRLHLCVVRTGCQLCYLCDPLNSWLLCSWPQRSWSSCTQGQPGSSLLPAKSTRPGGPSTSYHYQHLLVYKWLPPLCPTTASLSLAGGGSVGSFPSPQSPLLTTLFLEPCDSIHPRFPVPQQQKT